MSQLSNFDPNEVGNPNNNIFGLPFSEEESSLILLPVPWEVTVSYGAGTSRAAEHIWKASIQVDLLDTDVPDGWKKGFYLRETNKKILLPSIIIAVLTILLSLSVQFLFDNVLQEHQKKRIQVTLNLIEDNQGAGYNVNQSKIAIGSGGWSGKGFLNGSHTKGNFIPEQTTDFIFCTIGEEGGWLLSSGTILLFVLLILRLYHMANRAKKKYKRVFIFSLASILFFHLTINVGMTIGIMPVIGIPLPFISYGGSSILSFTVFMFTALKMDASRDEDLTSEY